MRKTLFLAATIVLLLASCGDGSSSRGGGTITLDASDIYVLTQGGLPIEDVMTALIEFADQCTSENGQAFSASGSCEDGGTWELTATINRCNKNEVGDEIRIHINGSMQNGVLSLSACASTVTADLDGDGTSETTNVILDGDLSYEDGTGYIGGTFDGNGNLTSLVINGDLNIDFDATELSGDYSATVTYLLDMFSTTYDMIAREGSRRCEPTVLTATTDEGNKACDIATDCDSCS